jgi:hypothetical protein
MHEEMLQEAQFSVPISAGTLSVFSSRHRAGSHLLTTDN